MYRVSEIADLIGVEKTEVFEKLITHKSLLDPNIVKVEGVTYFDERGYEILRTLFSKSRDEYVTSEKTDAKPTKSMSKFDREREILYDKIEILRNEINNLDSELELKDEMILKFHSKMNEDLENINKLQNQIMKNYEKPVE